MQSTQFNYTKILGLSGNTNSTNAFIQAIQLSAARGIYGVSLHQIDFLDLSLTHVRWDNRVQLAFRLSQTHPGPLGQLTLSTVRGYLEAFSHPH
jgi:hypothetical protein